MEFVEIDVLLEE